MQKQIGRQPFAACSSIHCVHNIASKDKQQVQGLDYGWSLFSLQVNGTVLYCLGVEESSPQSQYRDCQEYQYDY